jgi:hypothetical protein
MKNCFPKPNSDYKIAAAVRALQGIDNPECAIAYVWAGVRAKQLADQGYVPVAGGIDRTQIILDVLDCALGIGDLLDRLRRAPEQEVVVTHLEAARDLLRKVSVDDVE